jgi:hypothetical protein
VLDDVVPEVVEAPVAAVPVPVAVEPLVEAEPPPVVGDEVEAPVSDVVSDAVDD